MWLVEQGTFGAEAITASFSDPATANMFFNQWGWRENAFAYSEGGPTDAGLVYVDIGIHRFADAAGAAQALDYFCDVRQEQMLLADMAIAPIGHQSRAIAGATGGGTEASVYVRVDGVVIRVSVLSVGVDPLAEAETIAREIVARLG
jgi:hypothetical protein